MMELTKDDFYEIEKVLDIYAGTVNETLNRYCATAIHMDALKEKKEVNPLQKIILELVKTQERIKDIRDKLEQIRVK